MSDEVFELLDELSRKARKILLECVGKLCIEFGAGKNAVYITDFLNIAIQMASTKRFAPTAVRALKWEAWRDAKKSGAGTRILSEDWMLRKIMDTDPDRVMAWCARMGGSVSRRAGRVDDKPTRDGGCGHHR